MAAHPEQFEIKRAERRQARLRLAVSAASNGGKTWTALELAFGLVEQLLARLVLIKKRRLQEETQHATYQRDDSIEVS